MKITCSGSNQKTGKACSRKVAENGGWCYQHRPEKQIKIPEDISRVIGHRAIITRNPRKEPELIVIDDVLKDGKEIPKEVFESVITPSKNTTIHVHSTDIINHENMKPFPKKPILTTIGDDTIRKDYSLIWTRIKDFFKRNKK